MAQSYVPEDSLVVCTNMTAPAPQMLKLSSQRSVAYAGKDKPMLTKADNKLSATFVCKVPAKFWGGLKALAIGIAIGAAVVLTGGAALIVIGAALAVACYSEYKAYTVSHDCDASLDGEWALFHEKVKFDKQKALLNGSYLTCPKGGMINIIMDPGMAQDAATYISDNNNQEITTHMTAQFVMGFLAAVTAGTSAVAVGVSSIATVAMYQPGEYLGQHTNPGVANTATALGTDVFTGVAGASGAVINQNVKNLSQGAIEYRVGQVADDATRGLVGSIRYSMASNAMKKSGGYTSLAGFVASLTVGIYSDSVEGNLFEDTLDNAKQFNINDQKLNSGINIVANNG